MARLPKTSCSEAWTVRAALAVLLIAITGAGCSGKTEPTVFVGETAFGVELAATAAERQRGLSGREALPSGDGMLFVYAEPLVLTFWMKDTLFPLDFVWIGAGCTVIDITHDVPNPPQGATPAALPRYSSAGPASYNLEINAGEARRFGLSEGDPVRFVGITAESANC